MPFDPVSYIIGKQAGGGGGGDITVEPLSVTENGTTTAPSGKAYSPVTVNVPNSYSAGDEGKVVYNGALVAQTAHAEVISNGTIDTTLNDSVTVNVPTGGVKIANGTFTGNGSNIFADLNIGSKMALCDFVLNVWASYGTEFAYNDTYKVAIFSGMVSKHISKFVPVVDSYVNPTSHMKYDINNDGTITTVTASVNGIGVSSDIRNNAGAGNYQWIWDAVKLKQTANTFYLRMQNFNNMHKFVNGMTYNWEIIYYGSDPTNDIVEVSA